MEEQATQLHDLLRQALDALRARDYGRLKAAVEVEGPNVVRNMVGSEFQVKGSIGIGNKADVPWIGVFPENCSAQKGIYLVFLFAADGGAAYLSINQGTEKLRSGTNALQKRALDVRTVLGPQDGLVENIDLRSHAARPIRYQHGNAYAAVFERQSMPTPTATAEAFQRMVRLLRTVQGLSSTFDPEVEPKHLLFKWSTGYDPQTVAKHIEVAQDKKAVWWGKFGNRSVSDSVVNDLRYQLARGVATYAYLYGGRQIWVARVLDVTKDLHDVDDERVPGYYSKSSCSFFVLLTDFTQLPADWPNTNLVLASNPDPKAVPGALGNQTTPLVVYRRVNDLSIPLEGHPVSTVACVAEEVSAAVQPDKEFTPLGHPPAPLLCLSDSVTALVRQIRAQGFIYEPWQIAAYVTALRTKPFVILAGVSGTGKSKLPMLVASATGGQAELIPVRPDWTDSSEALGYCDLKGKFRPGLLLRLAREASSHPDVQFVCVMDEMNLARVEQYFAEILSRIEERSVIRGMRATKPLLNLDLLPEDSSWGRQGLPANLAIVGTVNMDESTHGFSRKVLDRAFTLEFSEVDLSSWETSGPGERVEHWPSEAWLPRARRLSEVGGVGEKERSLILKAIDVLNSVNRYLAPAQIQVGYRTRDEVALFVLHAQEALTSFVTSDGAKVDPLDLAIQMKVLPRVAGGSGAIRTALLSLLGWAHNGTPFRTQEEAKELLEGWDAGGRPTWLVDSDYPRTAARLCLMWDRLLSEGYTSFWL